MAPIVWAVTNHGTLKWSDIIRELGRWLSSSGGAGITSEDDRWYILHFLRLFNLRRNRASDQYLPLNDYYSWNKPNYIECSALCRHGTSKLTIEQTRQYKLRQGLLPSERGQVCQRYLSDQCDYLVTGFWLDRERHSRVFGELGRWGTVQMVLIKTFKAGTFL